jgi:hypothetical protein
VIETNPSIFGPVFLMLTLTLIVWVYMYAKRIPFIVRSKLDDAQMTPLAFTQLSPPSVANPSDNLKNLFEMPVLFYFLCLYLFVTNSVDNLFLYSAWGFVCLRILHSLMHCSLNIVIVRFWLYFLSCMCFFFMVGRAILQYL